MILYYNIKHNTENGFDNITTKTINFYIIKYNELIRLKEIEIPIEESSREIIDKIRLTNNCHTTREIF